MPINDRRVVATCTTIPSRCENVVEMAKSVLHGAVGADAFVLNLFAGDWVDDIPDFIRKYERAENRFSVFVSDVNYWSATKLVPSLKRFPEDILVTVDDDKLYQDTVVSQLLSKHIEHPDCVVSMKSEKMRDVFGRIEISTLGVDSMEPDLYMIPCTGGGALFPPHVFDNTHVSDAAMFQQWQKPQDDRWWMNYTMNGVRSVSAAKWFDDRMFSKQDFKTRDAIHDYLWIPENIRRLDRQVVEWLSAYSPKVLLNVPKIKIVDVSTQNGFRVAVDEYGRTIKL